MIGDGAVNPVMAAAQASQAQAHIEKLQQAFVKMSFDRSTFATAVAVLVQMAVSGEKPELADGAVRIDKDRFVAAGKAFRVVIEAQRVPKVGDQDPNPILRDMIVVRVVPAPEEKILAAPATSKPRLVL